MSIDSGTWKVIRIGFGVSLAVALIILIITVAAELLGLTVIIYAGFGAVIGLMGIYILELRARLVETKEEGEGYYPSLSDEEKKEARRLLGERLDEMEEFQDFTVPLQGEDHAWLMEWKTMTGALLEKYLGYNTSEYEDFMELRFEPRPEFLSIFTANPEMSRLEKDLNKARAILKTAIDIHLA